MPAARTLGGALAILCMLLPQSVAGQELADLDYDNLSFRGIGVDWGYLWPTRVNRTGSFAVRLDLGYAGPGLRIMPSVSYWSSSLHQSEITELEDRIGELIADQTGEPAPMLDLGTIDWRDLAIGVDAHVVWDSLFDLLTYGGLGVAAHILDGDGEAIRGTFVDDLLDGVRAGVNLHVGMEYPITPRVRVYGVGKYEVLSDFQFFTARAGLQLMTGPNAPGEER